MVKVNPSTCTCGVCKAQFEVNWEINCIDSVERGMGEETMYEGSVHVRCPECDTEIFGEMEFWEYPVGILNLCQITSVSDSAFSEETQIEAPDVYFYDI